jgi:hypothetical protein
MHVLTVQTKFTLGDRVRFDSRAQECSGIGTVYAITVDDQRRIDYTIAIGEDLVDLYADILEEEMILDPDLTGDGPMHVLTVRTKFTFGDRVRFDSRAQGCSGVGTVYAITVDNELRIDYMIALGEDSDDRIQPGILEEEMTLGEEKEEKGSG